MPHPDPELIAAWRELAIQANPGAEQFSDLVTGSTRDELMNSAANVADRVRQISGSGAGDTYSQARSAYGPGPTGGGGNTPFEFTPKDPSRETIRRENAFAERFNNAPRNPYGERMGISSADITDYTNSRFLGHVMDRLGMWATLTRSDAGYRRVGEDAAALRRERGY